MNNSNNNNNHQNFRLKKSLSLKQNIYYKFIRLGLGVQ